MMSDTPLPAAFAHEVYQQLTAVADPARAMPMAAYMKQQFCFFGIQTPSCRAVIRPLFSRLGKHPDADWLMAVAHLLWQYPERECQYVAVDLLVKFAPCLEDRHEQLLVALVCQKSWWDTIDPLAAHVFGSLCRRYPAIRDRMLVYAAHENRWLRRVAILHALGEGQATDRDRLSAILVANLDHPDFFIRKAMGWALRQLARHDPGWVRQWVHGHADRVSPLTKREALKRLPA